MLKEASLCFQIYNLYFNINYIRKSSHPAIFHPLDINYCRSRTNQMCLIALWPCLIWENRYKYLRARRAKQIHIHMKGIISFFPHAKNSRKNIDKKS